MKLDKMPAEKFMEAMATIVEQVAILKESKTGKQIVQDAISFRGSMNEADHVSAGLWVIDEIGKNLPGFLRENGESVYAILGAVDGQTVEQYKACFNPLKFAKDCRDLGKYVGSMVKDNPDFFN